MSERKNEVQEPPHGMVHRRRALVPNDRCSRQAEFHCEMISCSECGADCDEDDRYCGACGLPVLKRCAACGTDLKPGKAFCTQCGAPTTGTPSRSAFHQGDGSPADSTSAPPPSAVDLPRRTSEETGAHGVERRVVTVMFIDLVASTSLANQVDPEDLRRVLSEFQNSVAGEVARTGGFVAQFLGDGVLAYFGYPRAQEDAAERAVRAALAVVGPGGPEDPARGWLPRVRVGIATGLVVVGDEVVEGQGSRPTVVGSTPNLAARLQASASPGQVVIAATTRALLGERFVLRDLGEHSLKGFPDPVALYQVVGEAPPGSRFLDHRGNAQTPLVGRDHELALLLDRWRIAQGGEGQVVLLVGDPGIGKSRLVETLIDTAAAHVGAALRMQCSPLRTSSPWYPVVQLVKAGDSGPGDLLAMPDDASGTRGIDLALIDELRDGCTSDHPEVAKMTPAQHRERLLVALVRLLLARARPGPLLLIVEDAHWADASTLELLSATVTAASDAAMMLVVTTRPGLEATFTGHAAVTWLRLNRLSRVAVTTMIDNLTSSAALPASQRAAIVARADGVPLFVEELTRTLIDSVSTTPSPDDVEPHVPFNLQDSLAARLDRLDAAKEIASIASVIGREFEAATLTELSQTGPALIDDALRRLVAADIVHRHQAGSRPLYRFKHALVAEAAYEMLLRERRAELHRRLFSILRTRADEAAEVLARHAELGGEFGSAVEFWSDAGARALGRSAYQEALAHLTNALRIAERLPASDALAERQQALHVQQGQALIATQGYSAAATLSAFRSALAIGDRAGNGRQILAAAYGHLAASYVAGHSTSDAAREFVRLAERHGSTAVAQVAQRHLALALLHQGNLTGAREILEQAVTDYDAAAHREVRREFGQDNRVAASAYLGVTCWLLGDPSRALSAVEDAWRWAREIEHPPSLAYALNMGACLTNVLLRAPARVATAARDLGELAERYSFGLWRTWAQIDGGWAHSFESSEAGIAQLEGGLRDKHVLGAHRHDALNWQMLCEALLRAGRVDEASVAVSRAAAAGGGADQLFAAESHRLRAAVSVHLRGAERSATAEELTTALHLAKELRAPGLVLRAARDLARHLATDGERARARELIEEALDTIVGGDGIPDVEECRALLASLV